jgi:hypothetical protein
MLRMSYMPSDFHPIVLMIGSASDILSLSKCLRAFSSDGAPRALVADGGIASRDTEVVLREPASDGIGMFPRASSRCLDWYLTRPDAAALAEEVEALAAENAPSGSVTLECGRLDEVRVKVSIGEWEEGFLEIDGSGPGG